MKKLALLVLALIVVGLGASSCGKDKACKCTETMPNSQPVSDTFFPEEWNAESCADFEAKVQAQNFQQGYSFTCTKL